MKIAIFGATGETGGQLVKQALAAGHARDCLKGLSTNFMSISFTSFCAHD
jgi:putative NADH-flavin reductase